MRPKDDPVRGLLGIKTITLSKVMLWVPGRKEIQDPQDPENGPQDTQHETQDGYPPALGIGNRRQPGTGLATKHLFPNTPTGHWSIVVETTPEQLYSRGHLI